MPTPKTTDSTEATTENTTTPAEQGANAAPEQATSKKKATRKTAKPTSNKGAKAGAKKNGKSAAKNAKVATKKAASAATPNPEKGQPREGSKKQLVIDLLSRKDGATMAEIAKATGWQKHSIRGFISGSLMKKMELPVASLKNHGGERTYRIEK